MDLLMLEQDENTETCICTLKLNLYQACLAEFEQLKYNDPYLDEIRNELDEIKGSFEC